MQGILFQVQLLHWPSFFYHFLFELHRVMKSQERSVAKHVLQGTPEMMNGLFFAYFVHFSHFGTNATLSILGAARLFLVRVLSNQSVNKSLYLRVNGTWPKVKPFTTWEHLLTLIK